MARLQRISADHGPVASRNDDTRPPQDPIDHAVDIATHHLIEAEEGFVRTPPEGAVLDEADRVVRRAEDVEILAEEARDEAVARHEEMRREHKADG